MTFADASAACVAAGKRLCTGAEWQTACEGPSNFAYPYGFVYAPEACNGADLDPDCSFPDDDGVRATGAAHGCPPPVSSACVSQVGAYDLSGNLAEWTSTASDLGAHTVRGGAYHSPASALSCQADFAAADDTDWQPSLGFRCCADQPPLPPWIFIDGFEADGTGAWSATVP